jgi:protein-S-isoprenylcysteine O-methyltransferase Ste14
MEKDNINLNKESAKTVGIIHVILFHTYVVFMCAIILGVVLTQIFPLNLFRASIFQYIGIVMIILGSIVVYWAQKTTSSTQSEVNKERDINFFLRGPYKYTRNPTNLGLTVMSIGLGFLINSFYSVFLIIITYLISRFVFIRKQDIILEERYGSVFNDYKNKVRDWL